MSSETATIEEGWRKLLAGEHPAARRFRRMMRLLPSDPRCKWCNAPFRGPGSQIVRVFLGKQPSSLNPNYCNVCDQFARKHLGGAEIELSMLFADVRGSTTLAERMNTADFSQLISRFYRVASEALARHDALIDKLMGDQATGFFIPGMVGRDHARVAVQAARELLEATGYGGPGEAWIPVGIGVHTGVAFVGAVGSKEGISEITALGDAVNIAARLSSYAAAGEILVSEEACQAAGLDSDGLERRQLALKGRSQPVEVRVMRLLAKSPALL